MTSFKETISSSELTLMMSGFILGSSVLLSPGRLAGNMTWLAILLGMLVGMGFALIYLGLAKRFPGQTMVEIGETVYGKWLGKLVGAVFVYYLFHLGSFVVRNFLDFIKIAILPETPAAIILLVGLVVCGYAARSGIEVLARCCQVLVIITVALLIFMTILLISEFHPENYLPIFAVPMGKLFWASYGAATFPFGEAVVFMMIFPFLNRKKETRGSAMLALLIGGFVLAMTAARATGILGKTAEVFIYPSFYVAKMINIGEVFTRMEILVAGNFLMMGFIKISLLLFGVSFGTAQLFRLSGYRFLVFPLGVLMFLVALINFSNISENVEFANNSYPIYSLPFILGLPLLTLMVSYIRKCPKEKR